LIDEVDRADDEFEAFLFEMLAEASVTIPEIGTRRAVAPPIVVLTSNRTRDLHDALRRRCLYHWIDYPQPSQVAEIVRRRVPDTSDFLARQIADAVGRLRALPLTKSPGIAEAINWASALRALGLHALDPASAAATLGAVVKHVEDHDTVRASGWPALVAE
jgi:MoxR-like ATPase